MVYMFLANGFEEAEAVVTIDLLRRAGIDIKTVAIGDSTLVCGKNKIIIEADMKEKEFSITKDIEMIILPGGMPGADNLNNSQTVINTLNYCIENKIYIGAICAAPFILGRLGLLNKRKATCFPSFAMYLDGCEISKDFVVVDDKIITAKGMGVSHDFGFALISCLKGENKAEEIKISVQSSFTK